MLFQKAKEVPPNFPRMHQSWDAQDMSHRDIELTDQPRARSSSGAAGEVFLTLNQEKTNINM